MIADVSTLQLGFALSAGAATFFAPCAYPLLPGYVAFYLGDAVGKRLRSRVTQVTDGAPSSSSSRASAFD
jgi:cytochrome c biogenesis protein CcdA